MLFLRVYNDAHVCLSMLGHASARSVALEAWLRRLDSGSSVVQGLLRASVKLLSLTLLLAA